MSNDKQKAGEIKRVTLNNFTTNTQRRRNEIPDEDRVYCPDVNCGHFVYRDRMNLKVHYQNMHKERKNKTENKENVLPEPPQRKAPKEGGNK